jgi:hypothetical protein
MDVKQLKKVAQEMQYYNIYTHGCSKFMNFILDLYLKKQMRIMSTFQNISQIE